MTEPAEDRGEYSSLMAINRQAFARAHYEVAYHALAAALHSACDDQNRDRMRDVQETATRQGAWIDTHRPEHRVSATSARSRGHRSMFAMLENQAEAARHIAVARDRFVLR
jgi:hypothetical protein